MTNSVRVINFVSCIPLECEWCVRQKMIPYKDCSLPWKRHIVYTSYREKDLLRFRSYSTSYRRHKPTGNATCFKLVSSCFQQVTDHFRELLICLELVEVSSKRVPLYSLPEGSLASVSLSSDTKTHQSTLS